MEFQKLTRGIQDAFKRISPFILQTPLIESMPLSRLCGCKVLLKMESEQFTGSFKARGSLNKLMSLNPGQRSKGAITASTGNHGLGFARAASITGVAGTVFLPAAANKAKVEALSHYPIDIQFINGTSLETELEAKKAAIDRDMIWVSPYNDYDIICGQGTVGMEILQKEHSIDHFLITVGGGGLISGVGTWIKSYAPKSVIHACQPENSPEMTLSLRRGEITNLDHFKPTLSDGSAGGIEPQSVTFPICQEVVDDCILINEDEIGGAIRYFADTHHKIIEGAAAVALAPLLRKKHGFQGKTVCVVLCGSNIALENLRSILCA